MAVRLAAVVPEKHRSQGPYKTRHGQCADHGQGHGGDGRDGERRAAADAERLEKPAINQPFAGEAIQRRQGADGDGAEDEQRRRPRHAFRQPAHVFDVARVRGVDDGPGIEEEQRLEKTVVPDMQQRAAQPQDDPARLVVRSAEQGQAYAHHDDPDVFDAAIGQDPFDVLLPDGEGDSRHAGDGADGQRRAAPPVRRNRKQGRDADDAVHAHLEHDPGHHRRDVARGVGVGAGEPDMQGHDARLEPEADEGQHEDRPRQRCRNVSDRNQCKRTGDVPPQGEHREQAQRPGVGGNQVDPAGPAHLGIVIFGGCRKIGGKRHDFPGDQKKNRIARHHHQGHRARQQAVKENKSAAVLRMLRLFPVAETVNRTQRRHDEYRRQEQQADRIHGDVKPPPGQKPGNRQGRGRREVERGGDATESDQTADEHHGGRQSLPRRRTRRKQTGRQSA